MKGPMRITVFLSLALSCIAATQAAEKDPETVKAVKQLSRQIELFHWVEPYLERQDLGRLLILEDSALKVYNLIFDLGLARMETMREYQVLIVRNRYSERYYDSISSKMTRPWITEIRAITEQIVHDRGFDPSPYTRITESVFRQIKEYFDEAQGLSLPAQLKKEMRDLIPEFGTVLALAQEGDRPRTFTAASSLYHKIHALYPAFDRVAAVSPAFNLFLTVEGLSEFYREYAQIEGEPS